LLSGEQRRKRRSLPTGFENLDTLLEGLQPSDVMIIAAPPAMGPANLAMRITLHAATRDLCGVGVFSFAMNKYHVAQRLLAMNAGIDLHHLRAGQMSADERQRLRTAREVLSRARIWLDDAAELTMAQIQQRARQLVERQSVELIVIDNLHLIRSCTETEQQVHHLQHIEEVNRSLKSLATELHIPILVGAPLTREVTCSPTRLDHQSLLHHHLAANTAHYLFLYRKKMPPSELADTCRMLVLMVQERHDQVISLDIPFRSGFSRSLEQEQQHTTEILEDSSS
jgi:replicative DNA helicase